MKYYPEALVKLIHFFRQLPGVGTRTAERYAFEMLTWNNIQLHEFGSLVAPLKTVISYCKDCGAIAEPHRCPFCTPLRQQEKTLCVVASARDVFAIESTGEYRGGYHVLGKLLSPLDGYGPKQLSLPQLQQRVKDQQIEEVIIAFDSTLEGDATALYLKDQMQSLNIRFSRLAFGIPVGSSLDYIDGGTLGRALSGRNQL